MWQTEEKGEKSPTPKNVGVSCTGRSCIALMLALLPYKIFYELWDYSHIPDRRILNRYQCFKYFYLAEMHHWWVHCNPWLLCWELWDFILLVNNMRAGQDKSLRFHQGALGKTAPPTQRALQLPCALWKEYSLVVGHGRRVHAICSMESSLHVPRHTLALPASFSFSLFTLFLSHLRAFSQKCFSCSLLFLCSLSPLLLLITGAVKCWAPYCQGKRVFIGCASESSLTAKWQGVGTVVYFMSVSCQ